MSEEKIYPRLSGLLTIDQLPEQLHFIEEGIEKLLDGLMYKNLQTSSSYDGTTSNL